VSASLEGRRPTLYRDDVGSLKQPLARIAPKGSRCTFRRGRIASAALAATICSTFSAPERSLHCLDLPNLEARDALWR